MPLLEVIAIPLIVLMESGFGRLTRCLKSKHLSGNASFIVYQREKSFKREVLSKMPSAKSATMVRSQSYMFSGTVGLQNRFRKSFEYIVMSRTSIAGVCAIG